MHRNGALVVAAAVGLGGCSLLFDGNDLKGGRDLAIAGSVDDMAVAGGSEDMAVAVPVDMAGVIHDLAPGADLMRLCTTRTALGFTATPITSGGTKPAQLTVGDFNEDGRLDVAVLNEADPSAITPVPGSISIMLGNGMGGFQAAAGSPKSVCNAPHAITSGRFSAGTHRDIIVGCQDTAGGSTLQILKGNGNGTFAAASSILAQTDEVAALVTADFDNDGTDDFAYCHYDNIGSNAGRTHVVFQQGGVLTVGPMVEPYTCHHLSAVDLNGDKRADLVITYADNSVSIIRSHALNTDAFPTVSFTGEDFYGPSDDLNYDSATADLNGDGVPDIVLGVAPNTGSFGMAGVMLYTPALSDYPMAPTLYNTPSSTIVDVAVGDFDCDGNADVLAASVLSDALHLLRGKGDGTFNAVSTSLTVNRPSQLVVADLNGDHLPDVIVGSRATTGSAGETTFTVLLNASQ